MKVPLTINNEDQEKKFGGFCAKVLKNERNLIFREEQKKLSREKMFSEFEDYELENFFKLDEYEILENRIQILQFTFTVKSDLLFEALLELPKRKREIIIMSFWLEMTDADISKLLNISRQNVSYLRKVSLKKLYQLLREEFNELF